MLKFLRSIWSRFWTTFNAIIWGVLRLFGHYPPVPQAPHENWTAEDVQHELQNARDREFTAQPADLEMRAALIWGYANAAARDRPEIDLGTLPESQRNALMLMSDLDLLRLAGDRSLCAKWHLLDGKFPRTTRTKQKGPELLPAASKEEVVSHAFMRRQEARRWRAEDDETRSPTYARR